MEYFERNLLEEIKKWVDRREIIAIKGPRQSGKTTLLEMLKEWLIKEKGVDEEDIVFITFEDRELLEKFELDPKSFVRRFVGERKVYFMIDEAHYCRDIGQKLKLLYDLYKNIKFIITGSSSLEITSETARFLVGRLFSFELLPLNFHEFLKVRDKNLARIYIEKNRQIRKFIFEGKNFEIEEKDIFIKELLEHLNEYLVFGGYPEVVKAKSGEEKRIVIKNIFNTYIEKDVLAYLQITEVTRFRRLISILAFTSGNLISYEKLSSYCDTYFKNIVRLLDILQQTYIIKLLRPFHRNLVTELRKNPKVYFYDYGLRNYAINNFNDLELREDAGKLAENFILNQLETEELFINFWRTTAKAEVDFVLSDINRIIPIEVKFESFKKPKITRSFHSFLKNYKPKNALVVTKDFWGEKEIGKTKVKFVPIVYL